MIKFSIISIIIFLSLLFSNCNEQEALPYYTISSEFSSYCEFELGSSWVFQNDSTLVKDSITISEKKDSRRFQADPFKHNYQAIDMFLKNNDFQISKYEITAGNYIPEAGDMNSLLRLYSEDGSYQIIFLPQHPIGDEIIMGDEIGVYSNVCILNNFELNGNSYTEVWHANVVVSVNNNLEYNYWIAKNYGLIKFVITKDEITTSISLVSSALIQNK